MDTFNKFGVSVNARGIHILMPPRGGMSSDEAIALAAWLACLAGDWEGKRFQDALKAIAST